ncbi:MAG: alpha-2-macroglobulin family protein [Arenibacterium sp.]
MARSGLALVFSFFALLTSTVALGAQSALPEFRYVMTRDMDFYGADLDPVFDTDFAGCVRACNANRQCGAFTFNSRSNACFPKTTVSEQTPYVGALSAVKLPTDPNLLQAAAPRATALGFLRGNDLERARNQARALGLRHAAGGIDLDSLLETARTRLAERNLREASNWIGGAVSLSDRADLWTEYARLNLRQARRAESNREKRRLRETATLAAVNAYLRDANAGGRATALSILADVLEASGRGREMIPELRLASQEQPRDDFEVALNEAIAKYGFRITDTTVESDSAAPRICAVFSESLVEAGVDYEPYLKSTESGLVVQADGAKLCVDGVTHGQRYRLTFREGLPAASGETLIRDVEITQYVRDRSPGVRFPGRAYVLPKGAGTALPVETVNLTTLDLTLRRVSDRNLLRAVQDGYFGRPLSQWQEEAFSSEIAQDVWTGTAEVQNALNQDVTTRLPLGEAIADQPPGIYALSARIPGADPYDEPSATQWFVLSDLGLSSMSGADGLHVSVRGLSDAAPREGAEVTLVSRANAVLGSAVTDADGMVRFDPGLARGRGGSEPALLLAAMGEDDIGFLSLTDPAFDLSDRGVAGRPAAGPVDVFLTTDRGAYRAGETVNVTALARNNTARAVEGLPLIAILKRPDGVEYSRKISGGGQSGGHVFSFDIGAAVPRGAWQLEIKTDPDAPALASSRVLVEDFLPERIDFDLSLPDAPIRLGDAPPLRSDARYLFGAPGADLSSEGQVTLRAASTLADWPGYRFGRHDGSTNPLSSYFGGMRTDANGQAIVSMDIPTPGDETRGRPLEITATTRISDGAARPVERDITAPVRPDGPLIGIRPLFEDVVGEGSEAGFELIALGSDLAPQQMQVKWTLNRVQTRYQWYQLYGNWNWEPVVRRTRIATGNAVLGGDPVALSQPVDWGEYELVVERTDGGYTASSLDFYAGWYASGDTSATPDRLDMSLDRADYSVGDTAMLRIVPRASGTALITVMSNQVISRQAVDVPAGASQIPLTVTEDWGSGSYVSAMVIRPTGTADDRIPVRSLGIAHASIAPGDKALNVSIDAPDIAQPRGEQQVNVRVAGAAEGEKVWMTLAAVDLGILNLTGFKSPDPSAHYFGQRRLGMELRDVYGRLIDGTNGALGVVRSGGDAENAARLQSPPPTQDLVAQFSGLVEVGADGTASINIALPAFNGTIRLMAVAWSNRGVGQAERDMIVRDPVVVTAHVPRFLAPGDNARIRLELIHAAGPTGEMALSLQNSGSELILGNLPETIALSEGGKVELDVPVTALSVGDPSFDVVLLTPDGKQLRQSLRLPVRTNDPVVAITRRFSLAGGDSFLFSEDVFTGFRPGTAKAILSAGPLARFDAPGLLAALDRYPYGCTEQVTSQALPLLYLSSVANAAGLGDGPAVQARINAAIGRVLARQASNGAFGLWRAESGDFWLDAYVTDFLSRARAEGYNVPQNAFRLALDNLRNRVNYAPDFDPGGQDIAYALMVLAREGAAAMGDLRYYADVKAESFATPLALAQLGAALASYGDQARADMMFAQAAQSLARRDAERPLWRVDYGTSRRDAAAVLTLATEAASTAVNADALTERITAASDRLSTQEAAWSLLAAKALIHAPEQSGLQVNGAPVAGPFVQVLENATPVQGLSLTSVDGQATDITLTTLGVPDVAPEPGGNGYTIERRYLTMDGQPIEGTSFTVGQRVVTVVTVRAFDNAEARLMIDDPLPAGLEIDNPNLLRSGDVGALDFLNLSEARHSEFRSDRFLSAVDLRGKSTVTLAYIARAVSPGSFHHPAASVEDMYRPTYRARGATGRIVVSE